MSKLNKKTNTKKHILKKIKRKLKKRSIKRCKKMGGDGNNNNVLKENGDYIFGLIWKQGCPPCNYVKETFWWKNPDNNDEIINSTEKTLTFINFEKTYKLFDMNENEFFNGGGENNNKYNKFIETLRENILKLKENSMSFPTIYKIIKGNVLLHDDYTKRNYNDVVKWLNEPVKNNMLNLQ